MIVLTPNLTGKDGVSHLSRLIVRACPEATVLALHEPAALDRFEHAHVFAAGGNSARFAALSLRAAATCHTADTAILVHIHLAPAALAFSAHGVSVATCLCGIEAWVPLTWAQRAAVQRSRPVVTISAHTAGRFLAANPRLAHVELSVCHPGVAPITPAAASFQPAGAPVALIVGRMAASERYKGHDRLIDVWRDVLARVPGARLRIVGDGDDRARLESKAGTLGLADAVTFLGPLTDADLEREYDGCTAMTMPSRDEGFGLVFVEAMRAGRPCVALHGAASEIIQHGRTGLLVQDDDRELADAIVALLGNRARAAQMGEAGRARFLERFTEARFRERFRRLIPESLPAAVTA